MSTPVFIWIPSYTPQLAKKPRVLTAQFGDGYSQRVADGLNPNPQTWKLNFDSRDQTEAAAILAFLDAQGGVTAFQYTDVNGVTGLYICGDYGSSRTSPLLYSVTATFVQVFDIP